MLAREPQQSSTSLQLPAAHLVVDVQRKRSVPHIGVVAERRYPLRQLPADPKQLIRHLSDRKYDGLKAPTIVEVARHETSTPSASGCLSRQTYAMLKSVMKHSI